MMFDWRDLSGFAAELKADGDSRARADPARAECAWRAAVGRAYYAAYHQTLIKHIEYFAREPMKVDGQGSHKKLLTSLNNKERGLADPMARDAVKTVHAELGRLLLLRRAADYDAQPSCTTYKAREAIERLEKIEAALVHLVRA